MFFVHFIIDGRQKSTKLVNLASLMQHFCKTNTDQGLQKIVLDVCTVENEIL